MSTEQCDFGMVGLGTMGRNLVLNLADHGFKVAGLDTDPTKITILEAEATNKNVTGVTSVEEFIGLLKRPRALMLLVPAGAPVDAVIKNLLPYLQEGDIIIDGGNSHFDDTTRRTAYLREKGLHFLGVGISGGEEGARLGPSMMPGGTKEAYERVRPMFEAVAAKVNGEPCVAYLGYGAAGHYVKMVHNGIEYGIMQLLSEAYDLMKRGLGLDNDQIHQVFKTWNEGELRSFLVEITAEIFEQEDEKTGGRLIDYILDKAKQKGTGKWTSQNALDMGIPLSTIDVAVTMRYLSALKEERVAASKLLSGPQTSISGDKEKLVEQLRNAFYFAMITTYAQGMSLLREASLTFKFDLNLGEVARIWRGGCIIRASLLEDIASAFRKEPDLPSLLVDVHISKELVQRQQDIRQVVIAAIGSGIPMPAMVAALSYFDAYRTERLPSNLIQAQRDKFGAHTYERIDQEGIFHTHWNQK